MMVLLAVVLLAVMWVEHSLTGGGYYESGEFIERGDDSGVIIFMSAAVIAAGLVNLAAVLELVLDTAVAGPHAPASPRDLLAGRAAEATDVDTVLVLLADWFVELHPRFAPVQRAIEEAAAGDPDVAELARRRTRQRFDHYQLAATRIAELGGPSGPTAATDGAAAIWAIGHPRTYDLLVGDLSWSHAEYRRWVLTSLRQFLTDTPT
jgi:hypothetical protein